MNIRGLIRETVNSLLKEFDFNSPIKIANQQFMAQHVNDIKDLLVDEAPQELIDQAGVQTTLDFLTVEDGSNWHISVGNVAPGTTVFKQAEPRGENEDEFDYILRVNKIPYTKKEIKDRVFTYFFRRLKYNIPEDKSFETVDDIKDYIKMYTQKFLHGYMIPMASHVDKHVERTNRIYGKK